MPNYPVSHPPENRCSHCGKDVELIRHLDEKTGVEDERYRLINGGGRLELSFGYGSKHDLRNFVMYICDECVPTFIDSRKTKVSEFCCLGYGQDKALTPNVVVDQRFAEEHHAHCVAAGWKPVSLDELEELAAPVDQPPVLSPAMRRYRDAEAKLIALRDLTQGKYSPEETPIIAETLDSWRELTSAEIELLDSEGPRAQNAQAVDQPPTLSPFETYWRLNEELGDIRGEHGGQGSWQEERHLKKMEVAWAALIKASPPQVYHKWKLARSNQAGKLPECTKPPGNGS